MRSCFRIGACFLRRTAALVGALTALTSWLPASLGASDTNRFGFLGPEIFPIESQIAQAKNADLDGDGLQDLVLVNNLRSRISLLYNRTGRTSEGDTVRTEKRQINELPPDARFRIDSISSEKRISSLVVTDLNSDGRPDLAYYGEPKELLIQYNEGTNKWSAPRRFTIEDGSLDPYALVTGDLNGDKRTDLVLLAESSIYFLAQTDARHFAEPVKIPYAGAVRSIQVLDIDGDERDDLLLVNWDNLNPFRFRLQGERGELGPEIHFTLPPIRSYWADDLDGDHKTEIVTIAQKSGRAQISGFRREAAMDLAGDWKLGQFQLVPLAKTSKTRRGSLWADLNGDGRTDLASAEPESGQLTVMLQSESGTLGAPRTFATLAGVSDLTAADWDLDGKIELFLLSTDERQVGVTRLDENGRLAFPEIIPVSGRPLAMIAGFSGWNDRPALALIVENDGKRDLELRASDGTTRTQKLAESFKGVPSSLVIHDVDQDGRDDLLVLIPYEKMKLLLARPGGSFKELDLASPGGSTDQPWVSAADVDGDGKSELLLAQRNFIRAVVAKVSEDGGASFQVKEQINGASSSSRLIGAVAMKKAGEAIPAIFLLDAERKSLSLADRNESGVWQIARNIPLPFTEFTALRAISFGTSEPNAIGLTGLNTVAWQSIGGDVWQLTEFDGYETPIRDGFLHDVVSGDLDHDGRKDLVFLETGKSYLDLVIYEPPHNLVPANRWQVFEERTFRNRRTELPEPREAVIADFTGDGRNDLLVVVHDRVLLYPQE